MGVKEVIQRWGEKNRERKEMLRRMDQQVRNEKIIQERQLSSNERELRRYEDEDRESEIKERLEYARKKRQREIDFGHNPINTKNIMKAEWEVMKEKNQFSNVPNVTIGHKSVLNSNRNLLKNNKKLYGI